MKANCSKNGNIRNSLEFREFLVFIIGNNGWLHQKNVLLFSIMKKSIIAYHTVNYTVRHCLDMQYLELPATLVSGDFIHFVHEQMKTEAGLSMRYSFSGSVYFERMKNLSLYSINRTEINERVTRAGLNDIYNICLV
ncbi:hypothetical protein [Pelosinus sp. IPA-1]|uniref:hypothetical protein n=1 Tax=Pelosinus sp. IPA-1 TaxID=3029569 RepID=UPI0024361A8A|nr:hypothetical protein [Pelosinus sp. IPA-1]GMA99247.1 hypothetical protein PIPA1_20470 [Pelosinus sp. IPA-1]